MAWVLLAAVIVALTVVIVAKQRPGKPRLPLTRPRAPLPR